MRTLGRNYPSISDFAVCRRVLLKNIPFGELFFYQGIAFELRGYSSDGTAVATPFDNEYLYLNFDPFQEVFYWCIDKPKCRDWFCPDMNSTLQYCPF